MPILVDTGSYYTTSSTAPIVYVENTSSNIVYYSYQTTSTVTFTCSTIWPSETIYITSSHGLITTRTCSPGQISTASNVVNLAYTPEQIRQRQLEVERYQREYQRERDKRLYGARKALRRSVNLFGSLFGQKQIRMFLQGQSILVEGHKFDYRLSKKNNLLSHTAAPDSSVIPYVMEILDKQGNKLCNGCTVFQNTPVVDQLIALILHIREDEKHVLKNTNFFAKTLEYSAPHNLEYFSQLKERIR